MIWKSRVKRSRVAKFKMMKAAQSLTNGNKLLNDTNKTKADDLAKQGALNSVFSYWPVV